MTHRVAFRADVSPVVGVGHLMRSLALAEELAGREVEPVFLADAGSVPWTAEQLAGRGYAVERAPVTADEHRQAFTRVRADAVVFDSYRLPAAVYRAARDLGLPSLALVDGDLGSAQADLLLDQNIGAESLDPPLPEGATRLAGLTYALLRDEFLDRRPSTAPVARDVSVPHVLGVFGGTDVHGAGPTVVELLAGTGRPFRLTLVVPREELRSRAAAVPLASGQSVHLTGPTDRLAELVRDADLVVSAAGSSTWELLCLGSCAALVCVADNQAGGYQRLVGSGLVAGLGMLPDLTRLRAPVVDTLGRLLTDPGRRQALAQTAWRSVDGRGRSRVADALLALVADRAARRLR